MHEGGLDRYRVVVFDGGFRGQAGHGVKCVDVLRSAIRVAAVVDARDTDVDLLGCCDFRERHRVGQEDRVTGGDIGRRDACVGGLGGERDVDVIREGGPLKEL